MKEMITITKLEYLGLQLRDLELLILECNGVDNWGEYGGFSDNTDYKELEDEIYLLKKSKDYE